MNLHTLYFFDKGLEEATEEFSPSDIEGLQLWLDATDTDTLFQDDSFSTPTAVDSDLVGGWRDKSGNDQHVIQDTLSKRPLYKSDPVIYFDGVDDFLERSSFGPFAQPNTFFLVAKWRSNSGTVPLIDGSVSSARNGVSRGASNWKMYAGTSVEMFALDTAYHILTFVFDGNASRMYLDGVPGSVADPGSMGIEGFLIGTNRTKTIQGDANIGEILVYNRTLEASERSDVLQHLGQKWGIAI